MLNVSSDTRSFRLFGRTFTSPSLLLETHTAGFFIVGICLKRAKDFDGKKRAHAVQEKKNFVWILEKEPDDANWFSRMENEICKLLIVAMVATIVLICLCLLLAETFSTRELLNFSLHLQIVDSNNELKKIVQSFYIFKFPKPHWISQIKFPMPSNFSNFEILENLSRLSSCLKFRNIRISNVLLSLVWPLLVLFHCAEVLFHCVDSCFNACLFHWNELFLESYI